MLASFGGDRDFDTDVVNVEYGTSRWDTFSVSGDTSVGKRINFRPLAGQPPTPLDWVQSRLNFSLRPLQRLTINNTMLYSRFDDEATGAQVLEDWIARSRWNWQFTRALSLRAILQYERTDPNSAFTSITDRENWNTDLLLTYRLNPWTALFLGTNNNRQNVALDDRNGTARIVRAGDLATDGRQVVLKVSYLIRR